MKTHLEKSFGVASRTVGHVVVASRVIAISARKTGKPGWYNRGEGDSTMYHCPNCGRFCKPVSPRDPHCGRCLPPLDVETKHERDARISMECRDRLSDFFGRMGRP